MRAVLAYALMLVLAIALVCGISQVGENLNGGAAPAETTDRPPASGHALLHVLLGLTAILIAGRVFGAGLAAFGQPPVIGEVIAGIALGPSLLGKIAPGAMDFLFPTDAAGYLGILAQVGVVVFMFLVGVELNTSHLRQQAQATAAISHTSIIVPFVLGAVLALVVYRDLAPAGVGFTGFALFLGVALSVTAFPVLARILADQGLSRTPLGVLTLSCAAIDDVTAWCLLAFVVGVTQANVGGAIQTIMLTIVYLGFMLGAIRPLLAHLAQQYDQQPLHRRRLAAWVFVAMVASALATEAIGIHALFGAFLLGALIPHDSRLARELVHQVEALVTIVLLPAFFAYTGLRTQIWLVSDPWSWILCGLILGVAVLGKFGGSYVAARVSGLDRRTAAALGVLMNTRGLMQLIVLNVGLDLGVVSPALFAMMVIMALATTLIAAPLLRVLYPCPAHSTVPPLPRDAEPMPVHRER